jgi:phosphopantothenoylcysteine decarboxylase / phosphopantothenate---cysteine ligase
MPHVLLGVSGGIAAYKAADLVSQLVKTGAEVRVVMTPSATRFVGPLTFEAMSGHPVMVDALSQAGTGSISAVEHVEWAKWADVAVVAPATANTIARLACGLADDAVSTVFMALPAQVPVVVCPAMNTAMWEHPVVQRNIGWLRAFPHIRVVMPAEKRLACGDVGMGGLAEVSDILLAVLDARAV